MPATFTPPAHVLQALASTSSSEPLSASQLAEQIKAGECKAVDVLEACWARIEQTEPKVGAYLSTHKQHALQVAQEVDRRVAAKAPLPPLAGVPIALKDNINVKGLPTTCASKILHGYTSPYNATVVNKLNAQLMPIVGKTNLDEFAMGSSTENSALKKTGNPWDLSRVPGGSSGGSAATVSAGHVPISLGSDTGGSVRQPAALCGIVGLKPTYGLVSRFGLVAFGSSLDQISPFSRNVADTAAILQVISGFDAQDSTSLAVHDVPDYTAIVRQAQKQAQQSGSLKGLKVGVIHELNGEGMQPDVAEAFTHAIQVFEDLGANIQTLSLPSFQAAIATYYILATAEASSNLARFDGVRYGFRASHNPNNPQDEGTLNQMYEKTRALGFGPEVKRRIMLGTFALSSGYYDAYYGKAQQVRAKIAQEFEAAWQQVDVLICPTSPCTAFKFGEKVNDPVSMYLSDIATIPVNLAGVPAISLPCGFDSNQLPIGLQLIGPQLAEDRLLKVAAVFEQHTGLCNMVPVIN